jgi:hypothetical protein
VNADKAKSKVNELNHSSIQYLETPLVTGMEMHTLCNILLSPLLSTQEKFNSKLKIRYTNMKNVPDHTELYLQVGYLLADKCNPNLPRWVARSEVSNIPCGLFRLFVSDGRILVML